MFCRACAQGQPCRPAGCISTIIPAGAWAKWEMAVDLPPPKCQPLLVPGLFRLHGFLEDPIGLCFVRKISGKLELLSGKWLAPTDTCLSNSQGRQFIPGASLVLPCTLVSRLKTYLHMKQISPEEMQPVHTSLLCFPWLPAPASPPSDLCFPREMHPRALPGC